MDKHYEAMKELLEDQIKKITKKGDITPQELDNLYKASAIVLDLETREAMKETTESGKSKQSNTNKGAYARNGGYPGSMDEGQSNHYPWFMYYGDGTYDMSNRGNSYGPVWNQQEREKMDKMHNMSMDRMGNSRDGRSYDRSYDSAYDGAYDGSYDGSMDANNDSSYRRGRDARTGRYTSRDKRGYSRDKERMIGKLESMMDDAQSEAERKALQQCVDKLERQS